MFLPDDGSKYSGRNVEASNKDMEKKTILDR